MIIKTDPTIRSLAGKFPKSNLIMQSLHGKNHTSAKAYAVPSTEQVQVHQSNFKIESMNIYNVLSSCSLEFMNDIQLYTSCFNALYVPDDKLSIPYQNIFTAICYAAQKSTGFDLKTLTTDNFSELVNCAPTIRCFIANRYIPPISQTYYVNYNFMHHIFFGSVFYCTPPKIEKFGEIRSCYQTEDIPVIKNYQFMESYYQIYPSSITDSVTTTFQSFYEIIDQ